MIPAFLLLAVYAAPAYAEHPLLELIPQEAKDDLDVRHKYCDLPDRLVIATVASTQTYTATPVQKVLNFPGIFSDATMTVERSITTLAAPQVPSFTIRLPGGTTATGTDRVPMFPEPTTGHRYMLSLRYNNDYSSLKPVIIAWVRIPATANLPSSSSLTAAY